MVFSEAWELERPSGFCLKDKVDGGLLLVLYDLISIYETSLKKNVVVLKEKKIMWSCLFLMF